MLILALISLLLGMTLAQRFKVLVLAPFFLLTVLIAVGAAFIRAEAASALAETTIVTMICLQVGYLLGVGIRHVLAGAFRSRARSAPTGSPVKTGAND